MERGYSIKVDSRLIDLYQAAVRASGRKSRAAFEFMAMSFINDMAYEKPECFSPNNMRLIEEMNKGHFTSE